MAFFEIKDDKYDSDEIEKEVLKSLENRNIPFEQEKEFVDKYNLESVRKAFYAHPLTRFKILFNHMPRWIIRFAKVFPFYSSIRNFLKISD